MDEREIVNIAVSVLVIALSLTLYTQGVDFTAPDFIFWMGAFTVTVGSGFVLHELSHKLVAMRYGAKAAFEAWPFGLVLMLGLALSPALFGLRLPLFLAPGAVMISYRRITKKQNGVISLAGPVTNIFLAFVFIALAVVGLATGAPEMAVQVAALGAGVNFFLALFNMIPIFPLDGSKVMAWDWRVWLAITLFALVGTIRVGGF